MIETALEKLGVEVTGGSDTEVKGICPVHHLVTGRADEHPSWYMNRFTGAWLCHSCKQKGSLSYLVQLMGGDPDIVGRIPIDYMKSKLAAMGEKEVEEKPFEPPVHVSEYALSKHPLLGKTHREQRDLSEEAVRLLNIRYDRAERNVLLPVYHFDGRLMGWQEKAVAGYYFNNVPKGMPKRTSLFGFNVLRRDRAVVVESPLDAARFRTYGIDAVAIYGSYPAAEQMSALSTVATGGVVLAFDNDNAGHEAAHVASRMMQSLGVPVHYFRYPDDAEGADPGELGVSELWEGWKHATVLRPEAVMEAGERLRRKWRKSTQQKYDNTMNQLRTWVVKQGATT